jgi:hypothetical protein
MAIWKEIGLAHDKYGNLIFKEYICIYCNAYCTQALPAGKKPGICIDTHKRSLSVITCEGTKFDFQKN